MLNMPTKTIKDNTLILKQFSCAVVVDYDNEIILAYDVQSNEILEHTEGKLTEICFAMANEINEYFHIDIKDFNVLIIEEKYDLFDK